MKKTFLFLFLVVFIAVGCAKKAVIVAPNVQTQQPGIFDGIVIKGDSVCFQKTTEALGLLKQKAPTHYADVKNYVGVIECVAAGSGMYAGENPPRFQVGNETRDAGAIWYAGAIAHDANHSKLYHQYLQAHPGQAVPSEVWIGKQAESECIAAQYDALVDLGADAKTLDYLKNSINTDYWQQSNRNW